MTWWMDKWNVDKEGESFMGKKCKCESKFTLTGIVGISVVLGQQYLQLSPGEPICKYTVRTLKTTRPTHLNTAVILQIMINL